MPIDPIGVQLFRAETETLVLKQALREVVRVFTRLQPDALEEVGRNLTIALEAKSFGQVRLPDVLFTNSVDEKQLRQATKTEAIKTMQEILRSASKGRRP